MKLVYHDKEIPCMECKSFFQRFRGFMMEKNINRALLFKHCNSVHTFFMKEAIDIVLCDDANVVLYYYREVLPNHVILPKKGVRRVFELPVGYFDIQVFEQLEVKE